MNKLFLALTFIFIGLTVQSQETTKNALGIRLGNNDGIGFEISYQRALGTKQRLEADLGWRTGDSYDSYQLTGLYQWVWPIINKLNWFVGAGGGFGSRDYKQTDQQSGDNDVFVFIAGDVGIEYNFNIPLVISLDFRPAYGSNDYDAYDFGFGFRYKF
ncbi:hypothetical protein [Formosa sp. PL04]|uniref:hypothetical protein n=1 Tax=Formosa sp. PL04 TaxID=3081755 RepID=UPI002981C109|nr:hypothetical protein [Formosa sp. PL04]MDW5288648.1 hypothetical protein [Formosa sp. PL04]